MLYLNDIAPRLDLNGAWDFSLGDTGHWGAIQVPGAWEAQGYDRRLESPAHYRREVLIPQDWAGARIVLEFGAVSYACRVMVNGSQVGEHRGMWTPFGIDVTPAVHLGQANLIEVEVYKPSHLPGARFPFRTCLAGFVPDLGTTFGGLWQAVSLRAYRAWLTDWRLTAESDTGEIVCSFHTGTAGQQDLDGALIDMAVSLAGGQVASCQVECSLPGCHELRCRVPQPALWSPETPVLYDVELTLRQGDQVFARAHQRTGFRSLSASGATLLFNDRPIFLRGILHWGWQPDSIAPFFQAEAARAEIRQMKRLGFNLIKLCLFVPNQVYYEVADEEGVFLWQEWPMWLPEVDATFAERVPGEYTEFMGLARHHPSVVIYSAGCELDTTIGPELLGRLDREMRAGTDGALFCDNSGMGEAYGGLPVDFADFSDYHTYSDLHYFEEMLDHWRRDWKPPRPLIFGEFCDSDTYRDPDEVRARSGGKSPWWMTGDNPLMDWRPEARPVLNQAERMRASGIGLTPEQLKQISYAGSLAIRKYVLEAVRRRAGIGGYVVTALRDTPLTTTGVCDDFGQSKWSPEQFLPVNGECVLCLDGERRRRWRYGGDRVDRFDLQNEWAGDWVRRRLIFNAAGVVYQGEGRLVWRVTDASGVEIAGRQEQVQIDLSGTRPQEIAAISFQLPLLASPQEMHLEIEFSTPAVQVRNCWSIWSYPRYRWKDVVREDAVALYDPSYLLAEFDDLLPLTRLGEGAYPQGDGPVVASALPVWTDAYLKSGGKVILLQRGDGPLPSLRRPFWREAIRIFHPHPFWDHFVAGGDLRFLGISNDVSIDLSRLDQVLPAVEEARPIFRRLDGRDFRASEYLLEARLGRGTLLVCTLRLAGGQGIQPSGLRRNVAGQALLWTMLNYLDKEVR